MPGWLEAGLIGAVMVVVLKALGWVVCVNYCAQPLEWAAYGGIGALAAYWIPPKRTVGAGAGHGALAALVAAAVGGVVGIGVDLVGFRVIMPLLDQLQADPLLEGLILLSWYTRYTIWAYGRESILINAVCCCGGELVIAAVLGAVGGAVGGVAFVAPGIRSAREMAVQVWKVRGVTSLRLCGASAREALARIWKARTGATVCLYDAIERLIEFFS